MYYRTSSLFYRDLIPLGSHHVHRQPTVFYTQEVLPNYHCEKCLPSYSHAWLDMFLLHALRVLPYDDANSSFGCPPAIVIFLPHRSPCQILPADWGQCSTRRSWAPFWLFARPSKVYHWQWQLTSCRSFQQKQHYSSIRVILKEKAWFFMKRQEGTVWVRRPKDLRAWPELTNQLIKQPACKRNQRYNTNYILHSANILGLEIYGGQIARSTNQLVWWSPS